jgi:hypothetical protein
LVVLVVALVTDNQNVHKWPKHPHTREGAPFREKVSKKTLNLESESEGKKTRKLSSVSTKNNGLSATLFNQLPLVELVPGPLSKVCT